MFELRAGMPQLCGRVFHFIDQHRPVQALALAWTVCVHREPSAYGAMSKASFRLHRGWIDPAALHILAIPEDSIREEITRRSQEDPCFLLQYLARLCTGWAPLDANGDALLAAPLALYEPGGIFHIDLSDEDLHAFDLLPRDRQLFVLRENPDRSHRAPLEGQIVNHHFHTPGWVVVNREIARHQAHRLFDVQPCPPLFRQTALAWSRRTSGKLRVYLAEFAQAPQFDAMPGQPAGVWLAQGLSNDFADEVRSHLTRALSLQADVVVFPELCITDALGTLISDWLFDHHATAPHPLGLVVAGSFHRPGADGIVNQALAFGEDGEPIAPFAHVKLTSVYLQKDTLLEGNAAGSTVTAVPSAVGLQAVVICLDLGQRAAEDAVPLEQLPLSWLWVPSLSNKVTAHQARGGDIQLRQVCTIACANQGPAEFMPGLPSGFAPGQSFVMSGSTRALVLPFAQVAGQWAAFEVDVVPPFHTSETEQPDCS